MMVEKLLNHRRSNYVLLLTKETYNCRACNAHIHNVYVDTAFFYNNSCNCKQLFPEIMPHWKLVTYQTSIYNDNIGNNPLVRRDL